MHGVALKEVRIRRETRVQQQFSKKCIPSQRVPRKYPNTLDRVLIQGRMDPCVHVECEYQPHHPNTAAEIVPYQTR